jgi:ribosomal protein S18 acetylase RimI-like enzyme
MLGMEDLRPRDSEVMLVPEIVMPLMIRDLAPGDLPSCAWSGSRTHLASIGHALERAKLGEVEYLAACPPSGLPVALGGIDYAKIPGAGTIWQLAVHGALQSCGIGTILISAAEHRIRDRGLHLCARNCHSHDAQPLASGLRTPGAVLV